MNKGFTENTPPEPTPSHLPGAAPDSPPSAVPASLGLVETRRMRLFTAEHPLHLECGRDFGPIDVAYETYGTLNDARDNAILICHALSGDAHVAGKHHPEDRKPGWWDMMVGPGKPFDTDRYFVICSNCLGGCMGTTGPSSIDPATGRPYGLHFPIVTIADMVNVQRELLRRLGIEKLLAVAGGSMGGMQVLDWAIRYPEFVTAAIPIATTARLSAQAIAFDAVGRHAIITDEKFAGGDYYTHGTQPAGGLAVARMVGHITYLSEEAMHAKFGRQLRRADDYRYQLENEFAVETYLDHQGTSFVDRFDANTYLYFTKAMDYFDLARQYGDLERAFARTRCRFLVLSYTSDWLFPPRQSREIVDALLRTGKDVTYCNIDYPAGHDSFLLEKDSQGSLIAGFLARTQAYFRAGVCCPPVPRPVSTPTDHRPAPRVAADTSLTPPRGSIFSGARVDHHTIARLLAPNSTVLDLGCGNGDLLVLLREQKGIRGMGLTLNPADVQACVDRCVSVVQQDIEQGLTQFADDSYDYVVLSQTLQVIGRPEFVLREMLRVGRCAVVSFPNVAYWRRRLALLLTGRAPTQRSLLPLAGPGEPMNHFSLADFEDFLRTRLHGRLVRRVPLHSRTGQPVHLAPNLLADEAIFLITRR